MQNIQKELNQSIISAQEKCSDTEFQVYRKAVATVMADIFLDILTPIYKAHTEITPEGLKDLFNKKNPC